MKFHKLLFSSYLFTSEKSSRNRVSRTQLLLLFTESCRGLSPPQTPPYVPFMAYGVLNRRLRSWQNEMYHSVLSHALSMQQCAGCEHDIHHHRRPIAPMYPRIRCFTPMLSRKRRIPFGWLHCLSRRHRSLRRFHSSSSCSFSQDVPSNFLFHGSLPPRSCFMPAPRALTLAGQTLRVWLISLTAVGCFVLQVWDSASSRLRADFHRSAHIAPVVPKKESAPNRADSPMTG